MVKTERLWKVGTAVFFIVLTLIGLMTVGDYTGSYDELVQFNSLRINLQEYARALEKIGIRWEHGLGMGVKSLSEYVDRDYGLSAFYLCAPFLPLMEQSERICFTLFDSLIWLWFMAGVWSVYALSRRLGLPRLLAYAAALLLYLSPRFFAQGHYNDKDIVFLCLFLICLWLGSRFLDKMTIGRGALFSLAGAMAMNVRVVGALPWALVGVCAALKLTVNREWSLPKGGVAAGTIAAFCVSYFLLTPATWSDPLAYFQYLLSNTAAFSRWGGTLFFRGATFKIPGQNLPAYYLPYMMLVTLPLYTLPLAAVGQAAAIRDAIRQRSGFWKQTNGLMTACATLCWLMPVAAYVVVRPVVYNGWRHFFFCYAGVLILCANGLRVLWQSCGGKKWTRRVYAAALSLCLAVTAAGMALNHPYEASYYNVLASQKTMETDYWNSGGTGALKRLYASEERNKDLPLEVGCYFFDLQNARFKLSDELKNSIATTVEKDAPYLYYIENYVKVYMVDPPEGYHALFTVESYGRLIGTMYERDS